MENYIESLRRNTAFARDEFSHLTHEQFNFKPSADKWSVGQCMLHLVKTNKAYFPLYDKLLKGQYTPNFFEKNGWFSDFWEKFFVNGVDPKNLKKLKAPPAIQPQQSDVDRTIIDKLTEQNAKFEQYYTQFQAKGLENVIISSPFAKFITYRAGCTFYIIMLHELRHLQQAQRVKNQLH
jgi:hypothetical protein